MSETISSAEAKIVEAVKAAVNANIAAGTFSNAELPEFKIETPADKKNGDYSANAAFMLSRALRMPPRKIADAIVEKIDLDGEYFSKCEAAGAGFLNFFLTPAFYADALLETDAQGESFGRSTFGENKRINVEFVSANPTGPMHMGNARGGALGDCLAAVLQWAGYDVSREFYINDAGNQIDKFALSLDIRYKQLCLGENSCELPEDSYHGDDIKERAAEFYKEYGDSYIEKSEEERKKALVDFALPKNIATMKAAMAKYRIDYDLWFNESVLHNDGELNETIELLKKNGCTYEKDGALWYKNKEIQTRILKR